MRRTGWVGVILGAMLALALGRFLVWALIWALPNRYPGLFNTIFYADAAVDTAKFSEVGQTIANTVMSLTGQTVADAVWVITWLGSWALAYFLGGLVAGTLAPRASANLYGTLTAVCGGLYGVAVNLVQFFNSAALTDPQSQAFAVMGTILFSFLVLPFTILASYTGGKVAGKLRFRNSNSVLE